MRPIAVTVGPVGSTASNNIAHSQTPAGAGNLTLNGSLVTGGVAYLVVAQRILLTTTDSTHTATITGTTPTGTTQTEVIAFTGSAVTSALDYFTVTQISVNAGLSAAVTVGNGGSPLASAWVRLDEWALAPVGIQCDITGTVNYTIQSSMDDPNSPVSAVTPYAMTWNNTNDANAVGATGVVQTSFYTGVPLWGRVVLNTGSGSVTAVFAQSGMANR
jgi:hypothetical protein